MKEFRQLTVADTAEYHKVLIDGYAAIKDYPISFDAIDFTEEESKEWIENYPVYGLYIDGQLVSSITLRHQLSKAKDMHEKSWAMQRSF